MLSTDYRLTEIIIVGASALNVTIAEKDQVNKKELVYIVPQDLLPPVILIYTLEGHCISN